MGSNPTPGAKHCIPVPSEDIVNFLLHLKKKGYSEGTLLSYSKILRHMAKSVDLNEPEKVREFIANKRVSEGRKQLLVNDYAKYCAWKRLRFDMPFYKRAKKLPFIPFGEEVDALISGLANKVSVFCQLIKESGARPGEAWELEWHEIDVKNNQIHINKPEKGSNARVIKISSQLIARLNRLPRRTQYVFKSNPKAKLKTLTRRFQKRRKRVAEKMQNPRLLKISFLTLRHFKGTMEYHRTKDILHVKEILGHFNIQNTLVYTHLVNFENDEWTSAVAKTVEEGCRLVDAGFEYVCDFEGAKIFRKRK